MRQTFWLWHGARVAWNKCTLDNLLARSPDHLKNGLWKSFSEVFRCYRPCSASKGITEISEDNKASKIKWLKAVFYSGSLCQKIPKLAPWHVTSGKRCFSSSMHKIQVWGGLWTSKKPAHWVSSEMVEVHLQKKGWSQYNLVLNIKRPGPLNVRTNDPLTDVNGLHSL